MGQSSYFFPNVKPRLKLHLWADFTCPALGSGSTAERRAASSHPVPGDIQGTRLRALLLQSNSQGLSFSISQMDSFLVLYLVSLLAFFWLVFFFLNLSTTGLSILHHQVNFSWVVTRGLPADHPLSDPMSVGSCRLGLIN